MIGSLRSLMAGATVATAFVLTALARPPRSGRALPQTDTGLPTRHVLDSAFDAVLQRVGASRLDEAGRTWLRRVGCASLVALVIAPPTAVLVVVAAWVHRRYETARRVRMLRRTVAVTLPDAVDLLLLTTSAGWSLPLAHRIIAERVPPPLGDALKSSAREADRGRPRADALTDALSPLGDRARSLGHALADHLRYGSPLAPTLERLGAELRLDRRRQAEQDARRVPVRLLAPLVACVLPAFALLTVVPLLAASLQALPN